MTNLMSARRQVPWEIAAYSPQVHTQVAMALNSTLSFNEAMAAAGFDPQTRQDRDDLRDALQRMSDGFGPYLAGGSRYQPLVSDLVLEARDALRRGDLDAALDQLSVASEQRQAARGDDSISVTVDQVLEEASERLRPGAAELEGALASLRSGRGPGMSAMTAANRVRETLDEAGRSGHTPELTDGDIEALDRVDPTEAATAADWQHRRPERAPRQPADVRVHER